MSRQLHEDDLWKPTRNLPLSAQIQRTSGWEMSEEGTCWEGMGGENEGETVVRMYNKLIKFMKIERNKKIK